MLSLFSGIGGIDLAASWAGIETVAFCEIEPFCQKVLQKHWADVPIFEDVRTITKEYLIKRGVIDGDRTIDIVCGGYPCQPFSLAGKRQGEHDERHLWPEMFRIIQELRPTWVVGENVVGHISMGLDTVLSDLEIEQYKTRTFVLPAASVGANHKRERIFVVAHSCGDRLQRSEKAGVPAEGGTVASKQPTRFPALEDWDNISSSFAGRTHDGVSGRMDRLRALGNAVVPQQIYPILKVIVDIEHSKLEYISDNL